MENATKALLIAGGVLLAMMITSLIVITYNSLTDYEQSRHEAMSEEQIAKFNREYEAYHRDNVTGFDMVSLLNKILSYNALNTNSESDNTWGNENLDLAYTEMYIKFTLTDSEVISLFKDYGGNATGVYDSKNSNDKKVIDYLIKGEKGKPKKGMQELEKQYGSAVMSRLAGLTDYKQDPNDGEIKLVLGKKPQEHLEKNDLPTVEEVKTYQSYVKFKRGYFKCIDTEYNQNTGRIIKLIFEQK